MEIKEVQTKVKKTFTISEKELRKMLKLDVGALVYAQTTLVRIGNGPLYSRDLILEFEV